MTHTTGSLHRLFWSTGLSGLLALPWAILPADAHEGDWSTLYRQAETFQEQQQYQKAEALYRQILNQSRPQSLTDQMHAFIQMQLGRNLQSQGRLSEAIELLQNTLQAYPEDDRVKVVLNDVQRQLRESQQAITRGLQGIRTDAESPWGYRDFAAGLAAQKQLGSGLAFLEARLGHPLSPEQAIALARAAGDIAQYEAAIVLYRQVVTRYPQYTLARWEWLQALDTWGQPEVAIAAYRELMQQHPSDIQLTRGLAKNLVRAERLTEAIQVYEQLLLQVTLESEAEGDYLALGQLLVETRHIDRAIQVYRQAIQRFPDRYPQSPSCHGFQETGYDRLVQLLASQNRLNQVLSIAAQLQPAPTGEMYENLILALQYQGHSELVTVLEQQLKERFPNFQRSQQGKC